MGALISGGQVLLLLLPAGLSAAAMASGRLWLLVPAALLLPLLARLLPLCRGDEVLWTVLLSVPLGIPVNLPAVRLFIIISRTAGSVACTETYNGLTRRSIMRRNSDSETFVNVT